MKIVSQEFKDIQSSHIFETSGLHFPAHDHDYDLLEATKRLEARDLHRRRRLERRILRTGKVHLGWSTGGKGENGLDCGGFSSIKRGCLNVGSHPDGKVLVVHHRRHCKNPRCPICFKYWIAREAMRATDRLVAVSKLTGDPIKHFILSPPPWRRGEAGELGSYLKLRSEAYKISKMFGIKGGQLIYHPFRDSGELSPHFHLLGTGWVDKVREIHTKTGWVLKNKGIRGTRKQIYGTIRYELDHCGIPQAHKGRSIVSPITWFGSASYNKRILIPDRDHESKCPKCGATLTLVRWWGQGDHPCLHLEEGEYWLDPPGWDYADVVSGWDM